MRSTIFPRALADPRATSCKEHPRRIRHSNRSLGLWWHCCVTREETMARNGTYSWACFSSNCHLWSRRSLDTTAQRAAKGQTKRGAHSGPETVMCGSADAEAGSGNGRRAERVLKVSQPFLPLSLHYGLPQLLYGRDMSLLCPAVRLEVRGSPAV